MSETRGHRLIKQSFLYLAGSVYRMVAAGAALYVFSHALKPEEYGVLAMVIVFVVIVVMVANSIFINGIIRYFNLSEAQTTRDSLISSALCGNVCVIIATGVVVYIFEDAIAQTLFGGEGRRLLWLWLAFIISAANIISALPFTVWRMEEKVMRYCVCDALNITLSTAVGIALVGLFGFRVNGVLIGQAFAYVLVTAITLYLLKRDYDIGIKISFVPRLLAFGSPFILINGTYWIIEWSNQYILKAFASLNELGIYSVGYGLGIVMLIVVDACSTVMLPHLFSINREENAQGKYGSIISAYSSLIMIPFICLSLIAPVYFKLLTPPEYHFAVWIVPFIAFAYALRGLYSLFAIGVQIQNKPGYILYVAVPWAVINVVLNIVLISRFEAIGAAASIAITFIGLALTMIIVNQRVFPVVVEWTRLFTPMVVAAAYVGVFYAAIVNVGSMGLQIAAILSVGAAGFLTIYRIAPRDLKVLLRETLKPYLTVRAGKV